MRCPDCAKFVPFDTEAEPEGDLTIDNDGQLTGEVERGLPCGECGTTLKSAMFNVDQDLNEIVDVKPAPSNDPAGVTYCTKAHDWDWENADEPSISPTERLSDTDRKGNKIKLTRFMTKYYGIEIEGDVRCKDCPAVGVYKFSDEESASAFDEQV